MFKKILIAAAIALPLTAYAAEEKKLTPQQQRMSACNKEAGEKGMKGDERKKFMSSCLSSAKKAQQEKMTSCSKEASARSLKGDERKKFMSSCLSG